MFEVLYFIAVIGSGVYALNRLIRYRAAGDRREDRVCVRPLRRESFGKE
ncbi:MAG: hypothetical protein J5532_04910 [Lachnospiraceae bacterium]|nr:hypothetical protein [Lachnospiraceae bacterium]